MREAYVLIGIAAIIVGAGAWYAFNRNSTEIVETGIMASTLSLTSSAFGHQAPIPSTYTCDGNDMSPPLSWTGIPEGTASFALIMDDPDVPKELKSDGVFDHWTLFNIPPEIREIPQGGSVGVAGENSRREQKYTGPCPPPQYEPSEHRYFFRLYALDTILDLPAGSSKIQVLAMMEGHIIGQAELVGKYQRIMQ